MALTDEQMAAFTAEGRPVYIVPPWPETYEDNAVFVHWQTREEVQPPT